LRRWKLGFAALALVVVGVAADGVVKDAEFGTVRAKAFVVVDSKGEILGVFHRSEAGGEAASIAISSADKLKATSIVPGKEPFYVNR